MMRREGLVLLCATVSAWATADISVQEDWANKGTFAVSGKTWRAAIVKGEPGLSLTSDGQAVQLVPVGQNDVRAGEIVSCERIQQEGEKPVRTKIAALAGSGTVTCEVCVSEPGDLRLVPGEGMSGLAILGRFRLGLLPGRKLESVVYDPDKLTETSEILVPEEGWYAGFLDGNAGILVCTWPEGDQTVSLSLNGDRGHRVIDSIELDLAGREVYVGLQTTPGIWHREKFERGYLEKDVKLRWKKPFEASWRTELPVKAQNTAQRTFLFAGSRHSKWRPEIGNYVWPVWFDDDQGMVRTSKKIPPLGDIVVYPMEGHAKSIMGFIDRTPLDGIFSERNQSYGLPGGSRNALNVGFNACWGTQFLRRTTYRFGAQEREKEFLKEHTAYLVDRVAMVQRRNLRYYEFIAAMRMKLNGWLEDSEESPAVEDYLAAMLKYLDQVEEGHQQRMDIFGCTTPEEYMAEADRYEKRLHELLETPGLEVYPECNHILDAFNRISWAHDEMTGMRFSMSVREWAEAAALNCPCDPAAMEHAEELRREMREALKSAPHW